MVNSWSWRTGEGDEGPCEGGRFVGNDDQECPPEPDGANGHCAELDEDMRFPEASPGIMVEGR